MVDALATTPAATIVIPVTTDGKTPREGSDTPPEAVDLSRQIAEQSARITALEHELEQLSAARDAAEAEAGDARRTVAVTLGRYRALLLASSDNVPEELVQGDTVDAVDESFRRGRALVERLRNELEAAARQARVPSGTPQRRAADLSGMTPHQKILLGLQRKAG